MDSVTRKVCFKCGLLKPLEEFYKHPDTADGHLNKCKLCSRKDARQNYRKNEAYYHEYDKKRGETLKRKRAASLNCKKNRLKYPDKNKARQRVYDAKRHGKLAEQPCEICGALKVTAHHEDYSKPLDVIWLCPKHHRWIHN